MQFHDKKLGGFTATVAQPPAPHGGKPTERNGFAALSMYENPPTENITLEEFESLALGRLSVLKELESFKLRYANKTESELQAKLEELQKKHLKYDDLDKGRADQLSHYILRLAYCRTAELRKWFVSQECEVFRLKLSAHTANDYEAFLRSHAPQYCPVPKEEVEALWESLKAVMQANMESKEALLAAQEKRIFYKVHFTRVPDLVATRKVLLVRGSAYISRDALAPLILGEYRTALNKGLADIARRWRDIFGSAEEQRLKPLVASLTTRTLGTDYATASAKYAGDVSLATLPALSSAHFPLCMTSLMSKLKEEHHLRHGGRQQLSLFLKEVGLSMEEALMFWRAQFAPRTPSDVFDKQYAYNIRHNYGKEGKRADYSSHKCVTLISMTGGPGDHHGCPYRRLDESSLRASLARLKCDDRSAEEAVRKAREGHYQLACACAFEGMHKGVSSDLGISQPLQYYTESRRVHAEWQAAAAPAPAAASGSAPGGSTAAAGAGCSDAMQVDGQAQQQQHQHQQQQQGTTAALAGSGSSGAGGSTTGGVVGAKRPVPLAS